MRYEFMIDGTLLLIDHWIIAPFQYRMVVESSKRKTWTEANEKTSKLIESNRKEEKKNIANEMVKRIGLSIDVIGYDL